MFSNTYWHLFTHFCFNSTSNHYRLCTFKYVSRQTALLYRSISSGRRKILGIETSCDDTGIGLLTEDGHIVSEVCASQTALHVSNGGIIPPVACKAHRTVIDRCVRNCLQVGDTLASDLSAIAVTQQPGLPLSLLIGLRYAKKLSAKYDLPVIPVHHMEAHALTAMLEYPIERLNFPFVAFLISGGHCLISYVRAINDFLLLGQSIDCAPGDILDKSARALRLKNLGPPFSTVSGGAAVEMMAQNGGDPFAYFQQAVSLGLYRHRTCNFSFSGFQTAITRQIERLEQEINSPPDAILPQAPDICASLLYVLSFTLIKRLQRAFQYLEEKDMLSVDSPRKLVVSGGCAANRFITGMLGKYAEHENIELFIPSPKLCTDNGLMIAWNGVLKLRAENYLPGAVLRDQETIQALNINAKSPLGTDISANVTNANIKCEKINVKSWVNASLFN